MREKLFILFSFILITSCQNNTSKPVIAEPALKVSQKPIKTESNVPEDKVYNAVEVDVAPHYPSGIKKFHLLLNENFVVPKAVVEGEAQASAIFATFIIEKDGKLSNIKVLHDFGYGSGEEFLRVLKLSPNWMPATKNGKAVRCLYSVPYYCHVN